MHASPRLRRLRNDFLALEQLRDESSIFSFAGHGNPPHHYQLTFKGRSLCRDRGHIKQLDLHRVEIKLGASYPRTMPEIRWITPIYHPNISEIGLVCLGGYGTNWVPSIQIDELCTMLWDMARYHNYDIRSPYNRDSALWASTQTSIVFPTDHRPLRDLRAKQGRKLSTLAESTRNSPDSRQDGRVQTRMGAPTKPQSSSKARRFAQLYGLIFGFDEDASVKIESVTTRSRQSHEHGTTEPEATRDGMSPSPLTEVGRLVPLDAEVGSESEAMSESAIESVPSVADSSNDERQNGDETGISLVVPLDPDEIACPELVESPPQDEEIHYIR